MSISEKLTELNNIKEDIKSAIISKGIDVDNQFSTYADKIRLIGGENVYSNPFTKIGYYSGEEDDWLESELAKSQSVINNWNPNNTTFTDVNNVMFYPVLDTSNITSMQDAFSNNTTLMTVGLFDTSRVTNMSQMFYRCANLISVPQFNTQNVVNMSSMFSGCTSLKNIPVMNTSKVTNMGNMFYGCSLLEEIPLFNTTNVTNMAQMFYGCSGITYAPMHAFNTSKVTYMNSMFYNCTALEELSFIDCDLRKVADWENIVNNCKALTKVDFTKAKIGDGFKFNLFSIADEIIYNGLDTSAMTSTKYLCTTIKVNDISQFDLSNVTDMSYTFDGNYSKSIILGNIDTSKVTNMSYMFRNCPYITNLDLSGIDVSQVNDMQYIFSDCKELTNIDFTGWNTDSLTNMKYMFQNCSVLDVLDLSMFNISKVTDVTGLFYNCKTNSLILDGWDFSSVTTLGNWVYNQSSKNVSLKNVIAKGDFTCPYASGSIDLSGIDTTACTSFSLNSCDASTIDVSSVNTANFTSMGSMFSYCSYITSLDISRFDYSNVESMYGMFSGCARLEGTLTIGGNNKVTNMNYMFNGCAKLTKIDLTNLQLDLVDTMQYMFQNCSNLTEIRMGGNPAKITSTHNVSNMFQGIKTEGILYYNADYDYSQIKMMLPTTWKAEPLFNATECVSLTIEADDIKCRDTHTTIRYTAIVNGENPVSGAPILNITQKGEVISDPIPNNNTDEAVTRTISFTYMGVTATTTITQDAYVEQYYNINLNNQWQSSSSVSNPDTELYDGVYESFSNFTVPNANADCYITLQGYESFNIYVRSYGENTFDYVIVYDLDSESTAKYNTSSNQNSGTDIDSYTLVSFTDIDPNTEHTIKIRYKKDGTTNSGTDKGYLLIPKNQ